MNVKDIIIKPIKVQIAKKFVQKHHYSGRVVSNSSLHFGCFYNNVLGGVMSFGASMDKSKVQGLVKGTGWNDFIELNRMAFADWLPKNSESRCLSVAIRLIKKHYPHIKWIISFADGMQCGDGTIYRASGFILTGFSSGAMWRLPKDLLKYNNGHEVAHRVALQSKSGTLSQYILQKTNGKNLTIEKMVEMFGGELLDGFMWRYIYFIDKKMRKNLTAKELPFSIIKDMNAQIYKGVKYADKR
jgi:hypothetical protein